MSIKTEYSKTELASLLKLAHDQIKSRDEIIGSMHINISNLQGNANALQVELNKLKQERWAVRKLEEHVPKDCSTL